VQSDLFDTNEIFTGRCVGRDGGRQLTLVRIGEREGVEGSSPFSDLEPIATRTVPASGSARSLAQVNSSRAKMVEGVVEFEANRASSRDGNGLSSRSWVGVAANIVGGDRGDGRVVEGHTNGSGGGGATCNEGVPDVVGRNGLREYREADQG